MTRFRTLFLLAAIAVLATALVACGGDDGGGGADEDPQKILTATFSGDKDRVQSGVIDLSLDVNVEGDQGGEFSATLTGPFQSEDDAKLPELDLEATADASGSGQDFNFEGGLITTADAAFVNYNGTDYEVDRSIYDQVKTQFEQTAEQNKEAQEDPGEAFKALGIENPEELLTNLTNEGEEDVEGTTTTHISGDLDVDRTVEAFKEGLNSSALEALGATGQLPSGAQLDQVKDAVKEASFDIYTGTDDDILRRFTLALLIEPPSGSGVNSVDVNFDLTLGGVNEDQTIEAPADARPLSDLLEQFGIDPSSLGALGGLGGLGGTGGGTGTTPAPEAPASPGGGDPQAYLDCIAKAQDAADLTACNELAPQ